jgi:hypothetical protein
MVLHKGVGYRIYVNFVVGRIVVVAFLQELCFSVWWAVALEIEVFHLCNFN